MAKTYTSTIMLDCWKEHTCSSCGAVYAYNFKRKVVGTAGNAEQAARNADNNAQKTLANEVDSHPCPTCGLYQPDMIGQRRAKAHVGIFWAALVVFAAILILRLTDVLQANDASLAIAGAALLFAMLHAFFELRDPNRDTDANRRLATQRVSGGALLHTPGRGRTPGNVLSMVPGRPMMNTIALVMLVVAVVLAALPEAYRSVRQLPLNLDCYPPIAGPGDQTSVYMNDKITSIKGYWRGSPIAALRTSSTAAPIQLQASAKENDWGDHISVKSSEKNTSSTPWITLTVPNDPTLAGKTVDCSIDLEVSYPAVQGGSSFDTETRSMHRDVSLQLAPAHAGSTYNQIWWEATGVGVLLLLTAAQLLRATGRALQKLAKPTRILVPQRADETIA